MVSEVSIHDHLAFLFLGLCWDKEPHGREQVIKKSCNLMAAKRKERAKDKRYPSWSPPLMTYFLQLHQWIDPITSHQPHLCILLHWGPKLQCMSFWEIFKIQTIRAITFFSYKRIPGPGGFTCELCQNFNINSSETPPRNRRDEKTTQLTLWH